MKYILCKVVEILKLLFLYSVKNFFLLCSSVIKKRPNRIIFGAWFGQKYDDNPKYLYEHVIKERKDLDVAWVTSSKKIFSELKKKGYPVLLSSSMKAFWFCLSSKYVISCTAANDVGLGYRFPILNKAVFINVWHGVPLKKIMYDDKFNYPDIKPIKGLKNSLLAMIKKVDSKVISERYHIATSQAIANIYISAFRTSNSMVLNLGQARNDYFFMSHKNPIREQNKGKKIIVYMPTHRNEGKEPMNVCELLNIEYINQLCKDNNSLFLVKKHFYHKNDPVLKDGEFSNIVEITSEVKSQELIDAADILITDYSSVYIDYLLLDRPIIFYAYDLRSYLEKDREMYLEYKQDNIPGRICTTKEEIADEIKQLLNNIDSYVSMRKKMRDYYYSVENQGLVSARQIEKILTL